MRFPSLAQLDRDQRAIYTGAPPTGTFLVKGPPGTGKTVMALHRASILARMGTAANLIMFNKVLSRYTASGTEAILGGVTVSTMHKWAYEWWKKVLRKHRVFPPSLPENSYAHDWRQIMAHVCAGIENGGIRPTDVDWSHLIIDEGQDFPAAMYECLQAVASELKLTGHERPALSVFADENQRLNPGANSTLAEIEQGLGFGGEPVPVYSLKKNYRNTAQVAEFARAFYVGLPTGIPDPPTRRGSKPKVHKASELNAVRGYLARYAINNAGQEVGILCPNDKMRKKIFNSLVTRLKDYELKVQTYSYKDREEHPASALAFDEPNVLTVLSFQSAKGLEFDTVFIIDPFGNVSLGGSGDQQFKMQMYVMCSRARENLEVILLEDPPRPDLLPPAGAYEHNSLG